MRVGKPATKKISGKGVVLLFPQLAFHDERHQARASIRGLVAFLALHDDLMRYL